jgi:hypothetical protein
MNKSNGKGKRLTMVDFACQDNRSAHAMLHGYGDGRDKIIKEADLEQELLTDDNIVEAKSETLSEAEARKLVGKILLHGTGILSALFVLEKLVK